MRIPPCAWRGWRAPFAAAQGRRALMGALRESPCGDVLGVLARALARVIGELEPDALRPLLAHAQEYIEASDRRADALLFLLRKTGADKLRDQLFERALAL